MHDEKRPTELTKNRKCFFLRKLRTCKTKIHAIQKGIPLDHLGIKPDQEKHINDELREMN